MSESNKKTVKLKLPKGVELPDGVELLEIAVVDLQVVIFSVLSVLVASWKLK